MINNKGTAASVPVGLFWGAVISMLITMLGSGLMAILLNREIIQWEKVGYGIMIMVLAASFLGAAMAYKKIKRQRLMVCLLSGGLYWAILMSITALFFGGQYEAVGVTGALILAGCGCAGLLGSQQRRGGKHRKIRKVHS